MLSMSYPSVKRKLHLNDLRNNYIFSVHVFLGFFFFPVGLWEELYNMLFRDMKDWGCCCIWIVVLIQIIWHSEINKFFSHSNKQKLFHGIFLIMWWLEDLWTGYCVVIWRTVNGYSVVSWLKNSEWVLCGDMKNSEHGIVWWFEEQSIVWWLQEQWTTGDLYSGQGIVGWWLEALTRNRVLCGSLKNSETFIVWWLKCLS